jgi:hypothetical protein
MSMGEIFFLIWILAAAGVFAATLAYYSRGFLFTSPYEGN